jgi:hypothetical protein
VLDFIAAIAKSILSSQGSKTISSGCGIVGGWEEWWGLGRGDQLSGVISLVVDYVTLYET